MNVNMQLKETSNVLNEIGETLANTVRWNLASGAINTLQGSIEQAYGYAKNLDSSLNDIRIVTGKSADEMERFAEKANKSAKELKRGTTDYTDAALIYYQQGLSDEDVAARTDVTLKTANVTQQDTAEVSEQLTAIWNGYKVSAEEAELYIDKVAAVAATTASNLEELSTGMSKVASAANLMGVDIDQLNAQIATTVSVTRQAPESVGTAYKTIYARMSDIKAGTDGETSLGHYTGKMAEMGFNVLDETGQLRDMGEVIEEVGNKWKDLTREQQVALASVMAGTRQYNNLLSLFDNWDMYLNALETSKNAAGTLQEQQDIYAESTQAHLQELTTSLEGIYDSLIKAGDINSVVDAIIPLVDGIEQIIDSLGGGVGLLEELTPLMLQAFGPQMAKSMNSIYTNIQNSVSNKEQIKALPDTANQLRGAIDKVNAQVGEGQKVQDASKSILNLTENYNKLALVMNAEDFKAGQENIGKLSEAINRYNTAIQQAEKLSSKLVKEASFDDVKFSFDKTEFLGATDVDISAKGFESLSSDKLEKMQGRFSELKEQLDNLIANPNANAEQFNKILEDFNIRMENSADTLDDIQGAAKALSDALQETEDNFTLNGESIEEVTNALTDSNHELQNASNNVNDTIDEMANEQAFQVINGLVSGIGSLANIFDSFPKAIEIWNDDDLSVGEKINQELGISIALFGQFANVIAAGKNIMQAFSAIQVRERRATEGQTAANILETASERENANAMNESAQAANNLRNQEIAETVSTEGQAAANNTNRVGETITRGISGTLSTITSMIKTAIRAVPPQVAIVLGLVAAAAGAITILYAEFEKKAEAAKKRAEEAAETAKELGEAYEETAEKLDNLNDALDSYRDFQNDLKELTEGTQEWNKALEDSNKQVLELIKNYPSIAGQIERGQNGELILNEEAQNKIVEQQEQEVASAYRAKLAADIQEIQTQEIATKIELQQEIFGEVKLLSLDWDFSAEDLDKIVTAVEANGSQVLDASDAASREILSLAGFTDEQIDAIQNNSDKILSAVDSIDNNKIAVDLLTQEIRKIDFGDNKEYNNLTEEEKILVDKLANADNKYKSVNGESNIEILGRVEGLDDSPASLVEFFKEALEEQGYEIEGIFKDTIKKDGEELSSSERDSLLEQLAGEYVSKKSQEEKQLNADTYIQAAQAFSKNNPLLASYFATGNLSNIPFSQDSQSLEDANEYLRKIRGIAINYQSKKNDSYYKEINDYIKDQIDKSGYDSLRGFEVNEQNIDKLAELYQKLEASGGQDKDLDDNLTRQFIAAAKGIDVSEVAINDEALNWSNIKDLFSSYFGKDNYIIGAEQELAKYSALSGVELDSDAIVASVQKFQNEVSNALKGGQELKTAGTSQYVDEQYQKALDVFGEGNLTLEQQNQLQNKIQSIWDESSNEGVEALMASLDAEDFEAAINFTYNGNEDVAEGLSEDLQQKLKDLKVSEDDFINQKDFFEFQGKSYSDDAIANYLAAQKELNKIQTEYQNNLKAMAKDSSVPDFFENLKKDTSEFTSEETKSFLNIKKAMSELFGRDVSTEWVQNHLDLIKEFAIEGKNVTAELSAAKLEMDEIIQEDMEASLDASARNNQVKLGARASEYFMSDVEEVAASLEFNQEQTKALFQKYGYYWDESQNSYIYLGKIEDKYTYSASGNPEDKKYTYEDLQKLLGKENISQEEIESLGFVQHTGNHGDTLYYTRETLFSDFLKVTVSEDNTEKSTYEELLKKFGIKSGVTANKMLKAAGWVFDKDGNATRTIDEVIKNGSVSLEYSFDSVEEAIKQLGEGFEKALETGGATITDDGNGRFIATVNATISSEASVVGEQGPVEVDEDTSTTKEDTTKKDVTDKFQDLNDQINKYDAQLSHLQKLEKGLVGTALAENIQKQNKVREKQISLIKEKISLTKTELSQQREQLKAQGLTFDEEGYLTNSVQILQSLENTDAYDTLSTSISNYRSLLESLPDLEDSLIIETPEVDPLFEVNNLVDEYNTKLKRLQETQENFSGDALVNNLQEQVELYQDLIDIQKTMYAIRSTTLGDSREVLKGYGFTFDESGKLSGGLSDTKLTPEGNKQQITLQERLEEIANSDDMILKESYNSIISILQEYIKDYQSSLELLWTIEDNAKKQGEAMAQGALVEVSEAAENAKKSLEKANKEYQKTGTATQQAEGFTLNHAQAVKDESDALEVLITKQEEYIAKLKEEEELLAEREKNAFNTDLSKIGISSVQLVLEDGGTSNAQEVQSAITEEIKKREEAFEKASNTEKEKLQEEIEILSALAGKVETISKKWEDVSGEIETATNNLNSYKDSASAADLLKDDLNVYYEVDNELEEISDELAQVKSQQSGLEGNALIANLNQQKALIDKEIAAQKEKIKLAQKVLEERQAELETILKTYLLEKDIVAVFDEKTGKISNYNEILTAASTLSEAQYNKIKSAMDLVNSNADSLKEFNQSLKSLDNEKNSIDKNIKEAIEKQKEDAKKELEKKAKWFNLKVDVELDIADANRRLNDLKKKIAGLDDDDILGNVRKNFENYQSYFKGNAGSYFGGNDTGSITGLTSHLNAIISEINTMQAGGVSGLYGTDQESAFEDLYKYRDSLMSQIEQVQQLKEEIKQAYTEMLNKFVDKVNDILEGYKQINEIIDHNINLIKLTQGENAFASIGNWYDQKIENDKQALAQAKKEVEYWKNAMASAEKGSEEWEKYYEEYSSAISDLNSLLESSIQDALDQYNNLISKAMSELNAKLSGGYNLDYLDEDWEHATDMADRYLDKLNKAYEVTTLRNKVDKSLSDMDDLEAQKKLRDVMDEQLKILENKEYLTQYDVDRANKIYELTLKQIALEEAQNNKSKMRLRRDSQGNYRYEYVADTEDIADKQQELLDAQNDLYNFDKERYISILDEANQAYRKYTEKRIEILNSTTYTEQEKIYLLDELDKNFRESQLGRLEDLQTAEQNTMQSANDLSQQLLQEQVNNLAELIPQAGSTTAEFVHNILDGEGGINSSILATFETLDSEAKKLQDTITELANSAGVNLDALASGFDPAINNVRDLIRENENLARQYQQELNSISSVIAQLEALEQQYKAVYEAALKAVEIANQLRQQQAKGDSPTTGTTNNATNHTAGSKTNNSQSSTDNKDTNKSQARHQKYVASDGRIIYFPKTNAPTAKEKAYLQKQGTAWTYLSSNFIISNGSVWDKKTNKKVPGYSVRMYTFEGFNTGGYTGNWNSNKGKLAILHQKELVLNQKDTQNILSAVEAVRKLSDSSTSNLASFLTKREMIQDSQSIAQILKQIAENIKSNELQQNVKIEANFPDVKNADEIKNAFNNLINIASMHANSTKR